MLIFGVLSISWSPFLQCRCHCSGTVADAHCSFSFHLFDQLAACEETGFVRFHLRSRTYHARVIIKRSIKPYRDVPRSDPIWSIHVVGPTVDDVYPKNQTIQMTRPSRSSKQCGFMCEDQTAIEQRKFVQLSSQEKQYFNIQAIYKT